MRIFIFSLFILMSLSCQSNLNNLDVYPFNPEETDFSFLDKAVKGKRVVAVGQSSNGFSDIMSFKVDMVKYLHEKLDYDVLIFDTGYGDAIIPASRLENTDAKQLQAASVASYNIAQELAPLFEHIKETNDTDDPLIYTGYSPEVSSLHGLKYGIMYLVERLEPKIIQDSVSSGFASYYKMFQNKNDEQKWQKEKDKYLAGLSLANSILSDYEEEILEDELTSKEVLGHMDYALKQMKKLVDFPFGASREVSIGIRDKLMADNVDYIANTLYPDKKIIIWGHNGTTEQDDGNDTNPVKWMGHYLNEKFGEDYYSIGVFAKKGEYFQTWSSKNSAFDLDDAKYLEHRMTTDFGENVFVSLPAYSKDSEGWYHEPILGFEPESGGEVEFIPSQRFDALLLLQKTKAPIFKRK